MSGLLISRVVNNVVSHSQRQDPLPQHQDPPQHHNPSLALDLPEHIDTPEWVNPPVRTHSPASSQSGNLPPSSSKHAPPPPELPTLLAHPWPHAPLAPGTDPKAPRTANKVYDSVVVGMLTEAQHKFECLLFINNAYPNIDTQFRWSTKCWEMACVESERYFKLSKEMRNLVCNMLHSVNLVCQMLSPNRSKGGAPMVEVLSSSVFALLSTHCSTSTQRVKPWFARMPQLQKTYSQIMHSTLWFVLSLFKPGL